VRAERLEVAEPLSHRESAAGRIGVHATHRVQHLPRADVEDTVASGVEERQDGGRDWDTDAVEREEMLHAPALAPGRERAAGHLADAPGAISLVVVKGPRALPPAHGEELAARNEAAPRLRIIARAGTGVDNVDVAAASARGVLVVNAPGANSISVAEHALTLMLALARRVPAADQAMHCTYLDDGEIPAADMEHLRDVVWKNLVVFPWQRGDVVAIDNHSVGHGRLPYRGPRHVVVCWS